MDAGRGTVDREALGGGEKLAGGKWGKGLPRLHAMVLWQHNGCLWRPSASEGRGVEEN